MIVVIRPLQYLSQEMMQFFIAVQVYYLCSFCTFGKKVRKWFGFVVLSHPIRLEYQGKAPLSAASFRFDDRLINQSIHIKKSAIGPQGMMYLSEAVTCAMYSCTEGSVR